MGDDDKSEVQGKRAERCHRGSVSRRSCFLNFGLIFGWAGGQDGGGFENVAVCASDVFSLNDDVAILSKHIGQNALIVDC